MSELEELEALAPPPAEPARPIDWARARAALGVALPADYMALAQRYGAGTFAGLGLLVPGHPNENLDLLAEVKGARWALRYLRDEGIELPYEPDELLPWAIDEGGNVVWWHMTDPAAPERWPVVANEARGDEWLRFDGGAPAFVVALLSGRVQSDFLVVEAGAGVAFTRHPDEPAP